MLRSPIRKIGGYGEFRRYQELTASAAWAQYGRGNGVSSSAELAAKVRGFAERRSALPVAVDPLIGCVELGGLLLLPDDQFVDLTRTSHLFPRQVVKLKYFRDPDELATQVGGVATSSPFVLVSGKADRRLAFRKDRPGQAAFRKAVLANFKNRCCITDEAVTGLLEASHIQPYINPASDHPQNGLCLRVDLHRLYDDGFIDIDVTGRVTTSSKLAGTSYAALHGTTARLPTSSSICPSAAALAFHRSSVFVR